MSKEKTIKNTFPAIEASSSLENIKTEITYKKELLTKFVDDEKISHDIREEINSLTLSLITEHSFLINKLIPLLAHSLSLKTEEKHRVISKLDKLSEFQLTELIKVFEIEKERLEILYKEYPDDVNILIEKNREGSWMGAY